MPTSSASRKKKKLSYVPSIDEWLDHYGVQQGRSSERSAPREGNGLRLRFHERRIHKDKLWPT